MGRVNIEELEAVAIIAKLPDDTPLTTEEAAIFLRKSKSFLEKARRPDAKNPGPRYVQGGSSKSEGVNQKVVYLKKDLVAWLEGSSRDNIFDAMSDRGQLMRFVGNLDGKSAFWTTPDGALDGEVDKTEVEEFIRRIGKGQVRWLLPEEAAFIGEAGLRLSDA